MSMPSAELNPEPSRPEERAKEHLPPKSYAAAAHENLEGEQPSPMPPAEHTSPNNDSSSSSGRKPKTYKKVKTVDTNGPRSEIETLYPNGFLKKEYPESDGGHLISMKPAKDSDGQMNQDAKSKSRASKSSLVSGRQAGAGWQRSGIRWAPLNVPLQRRLQTFVVLCHAVSIVVFLAFFLLLCTIPLLWPILVPYLLYVLFSPAHMSGLLTYRSDWLRSLKIWSLFASYYPARLHRTEELPATRKYIFGYHPHGIIAHGAWAAFATEALGFKQLFPGITNTLLTLDSNFRIPLYRDWALRMGLASVSRESCENLLSHGGPNREGMGRAITIVIGGARESLDAEPYSLRLVLRRRKGFVKLAIRTGADLVPVLSFGENELYDQFSARNHPRIHRLQMLIKKVMGFTIPLFHARGVFNYDVGLMPYRRPINVVVGKPIRSEMMAKPSAEYVNEIHQQYVDELLRIWEQWKDTFAKERKEELEIIE